MVRYLPVSLETSDANNRVVRADHAQKQSRRRFSPVFLVLNFNGGDKPTQQAIQLNHGEALIWGFGCT